MLSLVLTDGVAHAQAGNGVYEMTGFESKHYGGPAAITRNCGKAVFRWGARSSHKGYA